MSQLTHLSDILDHLDRILAQVRTVEDVFKSISEADTFAQRTKQLRDALSKTTSAQPSYALITGAAFPGLEGESMRVSFSKYAKQLALVAEKSGVRFELIKPAGRNRDASEILCHFEGTALPLNFVSSDAENTLNREHEVIPAMAEEKATRIFVSFAVGDRELVTEFVDLLQANLPLRCGKPVLLWRFDERGGILPGEDNEAIIRSRMAESQFGLLLITPEYLKRPFIDRVELPHFLGPSARAHPIPVAFRDFTPGRDKNPLLDKVNVFQHASKTFHKTVKGHRGDFIKALCEHIAELIEKYPRPPVPEVAEILPSLAPAEDGEYTELKGRHEAALAKSAVRGADDEANTDSVPVLDTLRAWYSNKSDSAYMALLGESGAGKTMTCCKLDHLLNAERPGSSIYLDLRHLNASGYLKTTHHPRLHDILAQTLSRSAAPELTPERVLEAVSSRGALLIWDGLDEVLVHLSTQEGEAFFTQLKEALPPALLNKKGTQPGRLLMACRTQYFRSVEHESSALTEAQSGPVNAAATAEVRARFRVLRLLPFDDDQIRAYLTANVPGLDVDRAFEVIMTVHNLHDLAQRPYCLSIMRSSLGDLDALLASGEQVQAVHLYKSLVRSWLARDDTKHRIEQDDKPLLMARLAAWMWREGVKSLTVEDLGQWLKETILTDPTLRGLYGDALKSPESRDALLQDFRTATFIARWDGDAFRFAHTSLQEYFLACHLVKALGSNEAAALWDMPRPSLETLDFMGQLLALEPAGAQSRMLDAMGKMMGSDRLGASSLAFQYWLRAIERGHPEPTPAKVKLPGLDMDGWKIEGRGPGQLLNLRGADLQGVRLNRSTLRNVDLSGADLTGVELRQAKFVAVVADGACLDEGDLNGLQWRGGSFRQGRAATAQVGCHWVDVDLTGVGLPGGWDTLGAACGGSLDSGAPAPQADARAAAFFPTVGHKSYVRACAWSPDGQKILSGSADNTLKVWDAQSGRCLLTLQGHARFVWACAWSPNGQKILSGSTDSTLKVWDPASGCCWLKFQGHRDSVLACAWSPDGQKILSGSADTTLKVWNAQSGRCLLTLQGHTRSVSACAWSPDGQKILSGSADSALNVWDAASGRSVLKLQGHKDSVLACAWSPDGQQILSGSADATLKVWDATTGRCLLDLNGREQAVYACMWSPDGRKILSGCGDTTLNVWDAATGSCLFDFLGHKSIVYAGAWSPDGQKILSGSDDNTLKVWDAQSGRCLLHLAGQKSRFTTCAWSPNSEKIFSAFERHRPKIWNLRSGSSLLDLAESNNYVHACEWSPDGKRLLISSDDSTLQILDAITGREFLDLVGHTMVVGTCAWSRDGQKVVSGSSDDSLKIWDSNTGACLLDLLGHTGSIMVCIWHPDGQAIASCSWDRTIKLWDANNGQCLRTIWGERGRIRSCAWNGDGSNLHTVDEDMKLNVWDAASGECLVDHAHHEGSLICSAWSPHADRVLSGVLNDTLRIWNVATGRCELELDHLVQDTMLCAWSPDGGKLLSGSPDSTFKIWDANTGECLWTGHCLPDEQTASIDASGRLMSCSPEAWPYLGWRWTDPRTGRMRLLPAEHFGLLPVEPSAAK